MPAPELGGRPAGVVELAKKLVVGLLVGVVVFVGPTEDAFEPKLNIPPVFPPKPAPPNTFDVCVCPDDPDSVALFGVEKPPKLFEGAALLGDRTLCDAGCPKGGLDCLFPPNKVLLLFPPPKEGVWLGPEVFPNTELPPGLPAFPNKPVPDVVGGLSVEPNRPSPGFDVADVACPKGLPELPPAPALPKFHVGLDLFGSVIFESREEGELALRIRRSALMVFNLGDDIVWNVANSHGIILSEEVIPVSFSLSQHAVGLQVEYAVLPHFSVCILHGIPTRDHQDFSITASSS